MNQKPFIIYLVTTLIVLGKNIPAAATSALAFRAASSYCSEGYGLNITAGDNKCYACKVPGPNPEEKPCVNCAEDNTLCKKCLPFMVVTTDGGCDYCAVNCVHCDPSNNNACLECIPGYYLASDGQCKSCNLTLTADKPDQPCLNSCSFDNCAKCPYGSGLNLKTRRCSFCERDCVECSQDYRNCTQCAFSNNDGQRIESVLNTNGKCQNCMEITNACSQCYRGGTNVYCTECFWGAGLVNETCMRCGDNCWGCGTTGDANQPIMCKTCARNTVLDPSNPTQCFACTPGCGDCRLIGGKPVCSRCGDLSNSSGYKPTNGICVKLPLACEQGTYITGATGKKTITCTKCKPGYRLQEGRCLSKGCEKTTSNCADCNVLTKKCRVCKTNYYLYQNSCIKCPRNCRTCRYSSKEGKPICSSCMKRPYETALVLIDGLCYTAGPGCQEAIEKDLKPFCTKCYNETGYVLLSNGTCATCGPSCGEGKCVNNKDAAVCQECRANSKLNSKGQCVYFECSKTIPNCLWCQEKVQGINRQITCQRCRCDNENECYGLDENGKCTRKCTRCPIVRPNLSEEEFSYGCCV